MLIAGPHNATVNLHGTAQIICTFATSEILYLSVCAWSNDGGRINPSNKYQLKQAPVPGKDNQIVCTLNVFNVVRNDTGRYYCYSYYNESFWVKYHIPKNTSIISQKGEAEIQIQTKSTYTVLCGLLHRVYIIRE